MIHSLIGLVKILYYNNVFAVNELNNYFHTVQKTSTLRILGNGNSLNEVLSDFNYESNDYLVVNRHVLSPSFKEIKPKFYVLADPHFFEHPQGVSILKHIYEETEWEMILFVPFTRRPQKYNTEIQNENITLRFYNYFDFTGIAKLKLYLYRKNLSMPKIQNVMVAAIYLGICASYKRIELYGVEHSWIKFLSVNSENKVCLENPHFFDTSKPKIQTWEEIHYSEAKLHDVLRMYARMFESYWDLQDFAHKSNTEIVNYTDDSFIDAFIRFK